MKKGNPEKIREIFKDIAPEYDLTNTLLSLGIHHIWKRRLARLVKDALPKDGSYLDLCCGTGDIVKLVGKGVGLDFCAEMLEIAKAKLPPSIQLTQADATDIPAPDASQDVISIAFGLRNIPDYEKALHEMKRVLKPNGVVYILEFGRPEGRFFSAIYQIYAKHILPLVGGLVTGNKAAYRYLYETSWNFPTGKTLEEILQKAGFTKTSYTPQSFGIAFIYEAKFS